MGASLTLFDDALNLSVDYAQYDFEDRISRTTMNQVLTRDFNRFLAAGGDVNDPVGVQDWIDNFEDPAIQRDSTNVLTRVATSRLNAQKMKHVAWDFYGRYSRSFDLFGNFTWGLSATYVDEYSYDLGQGIPPGDGAGSQNESVAEVPPMPKWRVNGTVNWLRGNHSAFLRVRRISEFDLDFNSAGLQAFHVAVNGFDVMDPMTYTDLQYGYRFTDLFGTLQEARIEAGVRNVFDEFPEVLLNLGGIETFLHDVRGRMWYLRLNVDI